ncbi:conserved hypothetical protein [Burkholderia sp. 8Y]|nr:conserved hypothetical protein [Burkholderia sp. 8Y]
MVVDDYEPGAEALTAAFATDGFDARCVYSALAALQLMETWVPDIAVLDINMPEINGFPLAVLLRQRPSTSKIGIIAFTALDQSVVRAGNVEGSFDAYCQKAGAPTLLSGLVTRMLTAENKRKRLRQKLSSS